MAWYDVLLWIAVAIAAVLVVAVLLLAVMGVGFAAMLFGDGDVSLYAAIIGLCATALLLPCLLLIGMPVCYLWPPKGSAKRGEVWGPRVSRMFLWWTAGFRSFNE
ncbi:MAG: hypothetical protein AAGC44_03810 [Planctomycetota bacterium]